MNIKYITTTLPYVNSKPHVGHALEFIQGDTIARYYRLYRNVFFNVGVDCHGTKVYNKAIETGMDPQDYVDMLTEEWKQFCSDFKISYDNFYKTTDPKHKELSQKMWMKYVWKGDLYKKAYDGLYCVGCEAFKTEKDLINGKCPDHQSGSIQHISEENWFFKLSDYKQLLSNFLDMNRTFLIPPHKEQELRNLIDNIEDISVSRLKNVSPWGITAPNDSEHIIYIWAEALMNYLFAAGYGEDEERFRQTWDDVLQICGPDNLRFQGVLFQAMLLAAGIKNTTQLLVHGTVLDSNGRKMSKSEGNVIDPIDQLNKFGLDAVRYYAIAGLNTCDNSSWSEADLVEKYNSDLADDYGNLLNRTLHLINLKKVNVDITKIHSSVSEKITSTETNLREHWTNLNLRAVCEEIVGLLKFGNKYLNDEKPWSQEDPSEVLSGVYHLLYKATVHFSPVIPDATEKAFEALDRKQKIILFNKFEKIK